jgi:glycerate kinase
MRILIAPDKFKGSLDAKAVGHAIAAGLRSVMTEAEIEIVAVADGGEGTAEAIIAARQGRWIECESHDALGREIKSSYGWLTETDVAVMEMSAAAGLVRIKPNERNPFESSTFGVGELLSDAMRRGAKEIIIGLGGSATNDGGLGMARALGFRFIDRAGREIVGTVSRLVDLKGIERPSLLKLPPITAACDVTNPLCGPAGATYTFGPQKGVRPTQLELLDRALARLAEVAAESFGNDVSNVPGAGAAGGLGFGLMAFGDAHICSGFEVVAREISLRDKVRRADVVITGEGKLDQQSLAGKAPAGVCRMAREEGKRVYAIVGQATNDPEVLKLFDAVMSLDDTSEGYRESERLLQLRASTLARLHLLAG